MVIGKYVISFENINSDFKKIFYNIRRLYSLPDCTNVSVEFFRILEF